MAILARQLGTIKDESRPNKGFAYSFQGQQVYKARGQRPRGICDFQQCVILTSVDWDEPMRPPFKVSGNSKWCSVSSLTIIEYSSD